MKQILSSLEGMTSMYMASQPGPHTAQSIREIIAQLRDMQMVARFNNENIHTELRSASPSARSARSGRWNLRGCMGGLL